MNEIECSAIEGDSPVIVTFPTDYSRKEAVGPYTENQLRLVIDEPAERQLRVY